MQTPQEILSIIGREEITQCRSRALIAYWKGTISRIIEECLTQPKMTQTKLAEMTGVERTKLNRIRSGKVGDVKLADAARILFALKIDSSKIFEQGQKERLQIEIAKLAWLARYESAVSAPPDLDFTMRHLRQAITLGKESEFSPARTVLGDVSEWEDWLENKVGKAFHMLRTLEGELVRPWRPWMILATIGDFFYDSEHTMQANDEFETISIDWDENDVLDATLTQYLTSGNQVTW